MKYAGMDGWKINWQSVYNSSDSFPSLAFWLLCYYMIDTKDLEWANKSTSRIKRLGNKNDCH